MTHSKSTIIQSDSTILEAFEAYQETKVELRQGTLAHTKWAIGLFVEFLQERGHSLRITDIGRDEAIAWKAWLVRTEDPEGHRRFKPTTANSALASAAPVFRWLRQCRNPVIAKNPFRRIRFVQENVPVLKYTQEELKALIAAADWRWKGMIIMASTGGLARGEVMNLTWGDIDTARHRVLIRNKQDDTTAGTWEWIMKRRSSGGKERLAVELPITPNPELEIVLAEIRMTLEPGQPYPFVWGPRYWDLRSQIGSLSERVQNCPDTDFNRTFTDLCKQAGVEKGRRNFHTLRKTAITRWSGLPGMTPQDLQRLARLTPETLKKYCAVSAVAAEMASQGSVW